jgi:phage terminase small subunit
MKQRGRKSAAALSIIGVDGQQARPFPPACLSEQERELFASIVGGCDADHFRQTDLPLLSRYCEAAILAEHAALELRNGAVVDGKPSPWIIVQEKCVRAMVSLSMRLRLSPQSRVDPKTLGRQQPQRGPLPWEASE